MPRTHGARSRSSSATGRSAGSGCGQSLSGARRHSSLGRIGFFEPEGWPGFELGWALARQVWGRGYATEGARAALEYAFATLERERVISLVSPENSRSAGVARRIGEQIVDRIELRGKPVDVWAIDRPTWLARR